MSGASLANVRGVRARSDGWVVVTDGEREWSVTRKHYESKGYTPFVDKLPIEEVSGNGVLP